LRHISLADETPCDHTVLDIKDSAEALVGVQQKEFITCPTTFRGTQTRSLVQGRGFYVGP